MSSVPHVDVTVRYRGSIVGTRRLGRRRADGRRPVRLGATMLAVGLALGTTSLLTGWGVLAPLVSPLVLAAVLVPSGLVLLVIGMQRMAEPDESAFWLGPGAPDLPIELGAGIDRHAVVRLSEADVTVDPPEGFVAVGPLELDEAEAAWSGGAFTLPRRGEANLVRDDVAIEVREVDPDAPPVRFGRFDLGFAGAIALAFLAIAGTITIAYHVVPGSLGLEPSDQESAWGIPESRPH